MPPTRVREDNWSVLIHSAVGVLVFGLLAAFGPGLAGIRLPLFEPPWDFGWLFDALGFAARFAAPALAWAFGGLAVLLLLLAGLTRGFRSGPRLDDKIARAVLAMLLYPTAIFVVLPVLGCGIWVLEWFVSGFGKCVEPGAECVPAVP